MTFTIQMRGRHWPESMGWQDTDFQPDDCTPAEWVAKMNEGDPQIEYRIAPALQVADDVVKSIDLTAREQFVIEVALDRRIGEVMETVRIFRDASHLSGMDVAIASAVEELAFLRSLLKKVEG